MLTISKPLSGGQARTYHAREFATKEANYWSREQQGHSEWQGKLAQEWGLRGSVDSEQFARLTEGPRFPQSIRRCAQQAKHLRARRFEGRSSNRPRFAEDHPSNAAGALARAVLVEAKAGPSRKRPNGDRIQQRLTCPLSLTH